MSYRVCCLLAGSGWNILIPLASSQHNLFDIYLLLCIQYWNPDDGQKTCPKHVGKRNKYIKQGCAPSWIYLQDVICPV
jgi:hypothetical protein